MACDPPHSTIASNVIFLCLPACLPARPPARLRACCLLCLHPLVLHGTSQAVNAAVEHLQEASPEAEDILQLGSCKGDVLLFALQDYKSGLTDANPLIRQQWEEAGLLAALELLSRLQESGYKLEQGAEVSAGQGLGPAAAQQGLGSGDPIQQQQQQQGEELPPAKVDLSFVLRDEQSGEERRVAVVVSG